ncbi:MAG: hypothetical protein IPK16_01530 [Anaerolineales bacterium]|nr:hypothetical protein [Anaerolineales bacterium]
MPTDTGAYRETFQRFLVTGIALTSAAVEQNQGVLDGELREQALHA